MVVGEVGKDSLLRQSPLRVELVQLATYLLDDLVEEAAGVLGLDLLLNPPVWGEVRDIGLAGRACAAGEESDDSPIPGDDNGAGVARLGGPSMRPVVGQDGDLEGGLWDAILIIGAGKGLPTVVPVADPFFTTSRHFSPSTSRCGGLRIS